MGKKIPATFTTMKSRFSTSQQNISTHSTYNTYKCMYEMMDDKYRKI